MPQVTETRVGLDVLVLVLIIPPSVWDCPPQVSVQEWNVKGEALLLMT